MTDVIRLAKDGRGEWRWTRRSAGNNEVIGASTEGYKEKVDAMKNIVRTQAEPYTIAEDD